MKNGIPFKNSDRKNNLVLTEAYEEKERHSSDYFYAPERDTSVEPQEDIRTPTTIVVLISASLTCAAIALATGSYAAWLSRQRITRQALTDVSDILESCQKRMQQLESDLQRLPKY